MCYNVRDRTDIWVSVLLFCPSGVPAPGGFFISFISALLDRGKTGVSGRKGWGVRTERLVIAMKKLFKAVMPPYLSSR